MFSGKSKTWDMKVHRTRKNVLGKIDESDPFSQPLPEASHDEAPFSDLPKTSEDVDVNLNISGASRCDEAASSSSSSSGPIKSKSNFISSICKDIDKVEDFNLDDLMKHVSELLKLREKDRQSFVIVPRNREPLKALLRAIGSVNVVLFPTLLVAETVERFDTAFTNTEKCWHLIKEMYDLAIVLKRLRESAEGMKDVMQDATSVIIESALVCCTQIGGSASTRCCIAVLMEKALKDIMERLNVMHIKISIQIGFRVLTAIQRQERSHLSKGYATHAESGPFSQALPGAFHDEAPFSGSFNVSMESKGKNVDVSLNVSGTPRCDEASSSGYSDLPMRSEGQDVDVNLNISGAPRCDEAPSSSSSSGPTKSRSDLISSKPKDRVEDVNLDDLWKHISELLKLIEKGNHREASILGHFPWPDVPGLQKLKEIVSFGTDLRKKDIHGPVKALLEEMGRVNVATAAPLVVAHTLERFDAIVTNREKCWHLIKEMYYLAIVHKRLRESVEGMQDVMQEATSLIIEGALVCSTQIGRSAFTRFFSMSELKYIVIPDGTPIAPSNHHRNRRYRSAIHKSLKESAEGMQHVVGGAPLCCTQIGRPNSARFFLSTSPSEFERAWSKKLNAMYMHINTEITVRVFTVIQHQRRSHFSKEYPIHAGKYITTLIYIN